MDNIEELKKENEILKQRIWDLTDELKGIMKYTESGASLDGETQKAVSIALARMFIDNGAVNYLTLTIRHENDEYEITMQKKGMLTPTEKASKLQEKLERVKQFCNNTKSFNANVPENYLRFIDQVVGMIDAL